MNIPLDEVIYFDCITTHPSTGAATDADSTPTFAVYEEATDTDIGIGGNLTKRTSLTGNYRGTFTLSAANGFEVGKWYSIIVSATVNSIAGKAVVKNFRVVLAETVAGEPKVDVGALAGVAQSLTDLKDFADAGYDPSTHKVETVKLADVLTTYTGNTPQTGDSFARIGVAGVGLTNVVLPSGGLANVVAWTVAITGNITGNLSGSIGSLAAQAKTDISALTIARVTLTDTTTINTDMITQANVRTAVGLASANLDTQLAALAGYIDTEVGAIITAVADLPTNAELATALGTADDATLAAIAALNNLSQANIRTALGLGSANLDTQLDAIPTNTDLATALGTADDAVLAQVALVKAKTDNLPSDPADASVVAGLIAAVPAAVEAAILNEGDATALLAAIAAKVEEFLINEGDATATLAAIAAAVRTNLATELGRIDVVISTRLSTAGYTAPPSAAANASAVRTELTTELGRVDAAISTRATPAQVNTECDTALADYDAPTNAEMVARTLPSASYGTSTVTTGQVQTAAEAAIAAQEPVLANVTQVNSVTLQGVGTAGNPWRPA